MASIKELGQILTTLPAGKPINLYGIGIERMPIGLFQVGRNENLLTWNEAARFLYRLDMTQKPIPDPIPDEPLYPNWLRCMSLHFPWAYLIANGYKSEEFRSKTVKYRGTFLLHASQSKASDEVIRELKIPQNRIVRGAIIGAADIVDSIYETVGGYNTAVHIIENAIYFPEPVTGVSGKIQQLWPATDPGTTRAFNRAWQMVQDMKS